jgi:hypothetical protein
MMSGTTHPPRFSISVRGDLFAQEFDRVLHDAEKIANVHAG